MFNLFGRKKKSNNEVAELKSPLDGFAVSIEEVPDPVFSKKIMGEGVAIKPTNDVVVAPFDGKVSMLMQDTRHAVGLVGDNGLEVLIHIGLDTVNLAGDGFTSLTSEGKKVKAGDPLIKFEREYLEKKGVNTITMLVVTDSKSRQLDSVNIDLDVKAGNDVIMTYK